MLTAPTRAVTINGGMQMPAWYDYLKIGLFDKQSIDFEQVTESQERINSIIEEEAKILDGDYKKILIGGFSQGAALSFYVGMEHSEELGGVICLSGHQLYENPSDEINEAKKTLPVFAYHGKMDPLLIHAIAFPFFITLKEDGFNIETHSDSSLGHSVNIAELSKAREFISNLIG